MSETREERLQQANEILRLFAPQCHFELRKGRLWIVEARVAKACVLNPNGHTLACRYGDLGMGGTCARAAGFLVLWIRDEPRGPASWWRYWASPTIQLGREDGKRIPDLLAASSYDDPAKTGCVFCGSNEVVDWWSCKGYPTGPCCSHSGCKQMDVRTEWPRKGAAQ